MMGQVQRCDAVLTSLSNDEVSVLGKVTLEICITHLITARHEFIVTDMLDVEFLLGLDFLEEKRLVVDFGTANLRGPDGRSCDLFEKPRDVTRVKRIKCQDTVTIEPRTVQFIYGKIPPTDVNYRGITEPYHNTMQATGVLMAPPSYTRRRDGSPYDV